MDMREKAHATYMILQSVECFNDDPEGVGKLLEALGEHRNIVLSGSDEKKIVAVGHALDSDEKRTAIGRALENLEFEFEPFEAGPDAAPAKGESATSSAQLVRELDAAEREIQKLQEKLTTAQTSVDHALVEIKT